MASKGLGLRQTRGSFSVRGIVSGTQKDSFYKEGVSEKGNKKTPYRLINFGINYDTNSTMYVGLLGNEKKEVCFYNRDDKISKMVAWADRYKPQGEGYKLIGVKVGTSKIVNDKGEEVNSTQILVEFDAAKALKDSLKDDMSVFVNGDIAFSTYKDSHKTNFNIKQVYSCKQPVDFDSEDFKPQSQFKQEIIFMGISLNKEIDGEYIVSAKTVGYNSVEDIEMYIKDKNLASVFKKNLKPYTLIEVGGDVLCETATEEVSTDMWGAGIEMDKVKAATQWKLVINGADPTTIDTTSYSEEVIDKAIAKMRAESKAEAEFNTNENNNSGWGEFNSTEESYDGEEWD